MAHRVIAQLAFFGGRVLGRAFSEAWQQASDASRCASAASSQHAPVQDPTISRQHAGLTLDEACRILNVPPPRDGQADMDRVMASFKKLYDRNEPEAGGSFYLQSKVLRARERIEAEVRNREEEKRREEELQKGWKPRMYRR